MCRLTSRRSQPPLALAVPLSRFTSRVGGGSAFFVRRFMRTTMLVTLWFKILAIAAGIVCTLFGISFFYFGPEVHAETITANERLFSVWLLLLVFALFAASRTTRFRRIAALVFFWSVTFVPLALVIASFVESCLTRD